jgi:hypothetical protein
VDASQKEQTHDSEINSRKHSATLQKTVTTTTTFAPSKSSSQLIDVFRNQAQHVYLTPFISALAQPLPLTFRLRQNDALGKSHRRRLREAQRNLEDFSKFVRPVPWDETVYQSVDYKISKSTLSKHSSKLKEFLVAISSKAIIARQELGRMLPIVGLTAGAHLKPGHRVLDTCASPGSKTLQALEADVAAIGENNKNSGETEIYKRGHCSFFPTKDTGPFLPHSKITSENNKNAILDYLPRRKRIFFSFQRCTEIYLTPARSKAMARRD